MGPSRQKLCPTSHYLESRKHWTPLRPTGTPLEWTLLCLGSLTQFNTMSGFVSANHLAREAVKSNVWERWRVLLWILWGKAMGWECPKGQSSTGPNVERELWAGDRNIESTRVHTLFSLQEQLQGELTGSHARGYMSSFLILIFSIRVPGSPM